MPRSLNRSRGPKGDALDEASRLKPMGRVRFVPTVVADVGSNKIIRWKGEYGVLSCWEGKGKPGRRFESWEGPPVKLYPYEVVELVVNYVQPKRVINGTSDGSVELGTRRAKPLPKITSEAA